MEKLDRITIDAARMNGEPCIRDLRLTVRRVLQALATYPDRAELKREYPELEDEDIRQALAFAAALVDDKVLPFPRARRNCSSIRVFLAPQSFTFLTRVLKLRMSEKPDSRRQATRKFSTLLIRTAVSWSHWTQISTHSWRYPELPAHL